MATVLDSAGTEHSFHSPALQNVFEGLLCAECCSRGWGNIREQSRQKSLLLGVEGERERINRRPSK